MYDLPPPGGAEPLAASDPRAVGAYTLTGRLGAGGMGAVYLGRSPEGAPVAVKMIRDELGLDPGFRARFEREVSSAERVASFCTAAVLDHGLTLVIGHGLALAAIVLRTTWGAKARTLRPA